MKSQKHEVPIPTIKRLPSYLRLLQGYQADGMEMVSATKLAAELGLKSIQVRKDISCTGIEGKPKVGFSVSALIDAIVSTLGWDNATDAILVGVGHLGSALLRYEGFANYGLSIVAAFDSDSEKTERSIASVPIYSMEHLKEFLLEHHVNIAVLTVPAEAAQTVAEELVSLGITALWNFAPKDLKLDSSTVVQRTDLATSFAVLSAQVKQRLLTKQRPSGEEPW